MRSESTPGGGIGRPHWTWTIVALALILFGVAACTPSTGTPNPTAKAPAVQEKRCAPPQVVPDQARPRNVVPSEMKVLRQFKGNDTSITSREYLLIENADAFNALWKRHRPDAPVPPVDFSGEAALCLFVGRVAEGEVTEPTFSSGTHTLAQFAIRAQQFDDSDPPPELPTYGIFIIPALRAPLQLEIAISAKAARQSGWRTLKVFRQDLPQAPLARPARQWTGSASKIADSAGMPRAEAILTLDAWQDLWRRHAITAAPEVDFTKDFAVAVFGGRTANSRGMRFIGCFSGAAHSLRFVNDIEPRAEKEEYGNPFGIYVFSRGEFKVASELRIEVAGLAVWDEETRQYRVPDQDHPPEFMQVERFEVPRVAAAGAGSGSPEDRGAAPRAPFKVLRQWTGGDSGIFVREYHLVRDAESWRTLFARHAEGAVAPEVDFAKEMVLALFAGQKDSEVAEIAGVFASRRHLIRVNFRAKPKSPPLQWKSPYGLFVLPASDAPLVIEEDAQTLKKAPPRYLAVKTFQAGGPLLDAHKWWPVHEFFGAASAIGSSDGRADVVIPTTVAEWDRLWSQISPGLPKPEIGGNWPIFAVLGGRTPNGVAMVLEEVLVGELSLVVRFREEIKVRDSGSAAAFPYGVFVMPPHHDASQAEVNISFEELDLFKVDNGKTVLRSRNDPTVFEAIHPDRIHLGEYKPR